MNLNQPYSQPDDEQLASAVGQVESGTSAPLRPAFYIPMAKPFWTRVLIGCNLLVFIGMIAYGYFVYHDPDGTSNSQVLIDFGAKVNMLIAQGQVWRLFTAMFIHIGVIHILFNLYALNSLGPMAEGFFGHPRFLAIYLLGGLFGSLASYAFSPSISAGASGAIFALIGGTTVYFLRYHSNFGTRGRAILQNMFVVIVINLIFGLSMPGIDNWGHIGGLVGGALVAWGLLPRYRPPTVVQVGPQPMLEEHKLGLEAAWVIGCLVLLIAGVWLATLYPMTNLRG
ncbi:hypothetical protein BH10CHL1_BH10CHL1_21970 [soil metagenome]